MKAVIRIDISANREKKIHLKYFNDKPKINLIKQKNSIAK